MKRHLNKLITVAGLMMSLPFGFAQAATTNYMQLAYNLAHNTNLSPQAVQMALVGYQWALKTTTVKHRDILTIVDFTVSSAKDRLYVINIKTGAILMALPVTHGEHSGKKNSPWTTDFSNKPNSLESSVGVFVTENPYVGQHGYSLRIRGLEASNNNVESRAVVVHGATYASPAFIKVYGYLGTSWGCFAVDPRRNKQLISFIKDGTIMYAYGKSAQYMASTKIFQVSA